MTILGTFIPGSPEWLEARRLRVGGSEIAAACGWSKWETRDELLRRKAGLLAPREGTKAMERGHALETAVLAWGMERANILCNERASKHTYNHHENGRLLYNPDALGTDATGAVLCEAKTTANRATEDGWGRAGTDQVPLAYAAQVQWGLGVLGLDRAYLFCLHGATNGRPDLQLATYKITAQPKHFAFMRGKAEAFLAELDALLTLNERSAT